MDTIKRSFALRSQLMTLNKATSDKPEPTPGYLYKDIAKLTFESSQMSADLMEYLLARVKKKSVHTKIKALKILKFCVEKGHEGFSKDLQRRSDEIRQAMEFKGTVDPLHGDTFNKQVREHASKLMEALYNPKSTGPRAPPDASKTSIANDAFGSSGSAFGGGGGGGGSRSGGVGGSSQRTAATRTTGSSYASSTSSSASNLGQYYYTETTSASGMKMWGMGSGPVKPDSFVDKMKARVNKAKDRVVTALSDKPDEDNAGYTQVRGDAHDEMAQAFRSTGGGAPMTSARGVGGTRRSVGGGRGTGTYRSPEETTISAETSSISTDPDYIARVVNTITAPGGVKVAPPQQDLDKFVDKCKTLDGHQVADALLDRLESAESDRETLRILHVVKALASSSIIGIEACLEPLRDMLDEHVEGTHTGIRKKAKEILKLLDQKEASYRGKGEQETSASTQQHQQQQQQQQQQAAPTNLLDLDEPQAASSSGGDFGGLEGLLSSGSQQQQQQQQQQQGESSAPPSSLFSGMSLGGGVATPTSTAPTAPATTSAPAASTSGSLLDMDDTPTSTAGSSSGSSVGGGGSSLFSGMAIAGSGDASSSTAATQQQHQQQQQEEAARDASNGGSLLDLGDVFAPSSGVASGNDTTTATVAQQQQQQQQSSGFASLLGGPPGQEQQQQQQQPQQQQAFDLSLLYTQQQQQQQQPMPMMQQPVMMQQPPPQAQQQQQMGGGMMPMMMMTGGGAGSGMAATTGAANGRKAAPPKEKKADAFDFVAQKLAKSRK